METSTDNHKIYGSWSIYAVCMHVFRHLL